MLQADAPPRQFGVRPNLFGQHSDARFDRGEVVRLGIGQDRLVQPNDLGGDRQPTRLFSGCSMALEERLEKIEAILVVLVERQQREWYYRRLLCKASNA